MISSFPPTTTLTTIIIPQKKRHKTNMEGGMYISTHVRMRGLMHIVTITVKTMYSF